MDFFPPELENFACCKKTTEYEVLSDNGDSDLSSAESSGEEDDTTNDSITKRRWEWKFHLQLEDAAVGPNQHKERFWVAVDNQAAQCLMNLDASDLKRDPETMDNLRQRLFLVWGELEEHKVREEEKREKAVQAAKMGQAPDDSDDEEGPQMVDSKVTNRPFSCCIRQYGVKVREPDQGKADAGEGRRWQRMFGLYGTRISGT